jgi:hypothetical protein
MGKKKTSSVKQHVVARDDMINFVWTSHISVGSARQHPVLPSRTRLPEHAEPVLGFRRPPVMAEGPSSKTQVGNGHATCPHGSMPLAAVRPDRFVSLGSGRLIRSRLFLREQGFE